LKRRDFLSITTSLAVGLAVGVTLAEPEDAAYSRQFFDRLQIHIQKISQRERRSVASIQIESPVEFDGERFRFVWLHLDGVRSAFTWYEPV
jgi:hypothetical protein